MHVGLALVADHANLTADGKLNILGVFERILVTGPFPTTVPALSLVYTLVVGPAERGTPRTIVITLVDPDGQPVLQGRSTVDLPLDLPLHIGLPQILPVYGVALAKPGTYRFVMRIDEKEQATAPLQVVVASSTACSSEPAASPPLMH